MPGGAGSPGGHDAVARSRPLSGYPGQDDPRYAFSRKGIHTSDLFHEATEALNLAKRDFTAVSSLNAMAANATNQACENAVRALWEISTGIPFPQDHFTPYHKPAVYVRRMGIESYYSAEARAFLAKLDGWALDDVRYWHTQPYKDHTKPSAHGRGKEIVDGAAQFLAESQSLSARSDVQEAIGRYKDTKVSGR